jgi:hypothetical protein
VDALVQQTGTATTLTLLVSLPSGGAAVVQRDGAGQWRTTAL